MSASSTKVICQINCTFLVWLSVDGSLYSSQMNWGGSVSWRRCGISLALAQHLAARLGGSVAPKRDGSHLRRLTRRPPAQCAHPVISISLTGRTSPLDSSLSLIRSSHPCFSSQGRRYSPFGSYQPSMPKQRVATAPNTLFQAINHPYVARVFSDIIHPD